MEEELVIIPLCILRDVFTEDRPIPSVRVAKQASSRPPLMIR